ncbi:redox-active disulfide protein 2 [Desulfuromonas versatilis]|uniref:Redox-active disulfide protein 2 n=1 Tax=Desulfuromonas versatilis TaxID=2802975 RepID=A0ABM8HW99_9BACT|nr:thioredoxin family protein [Desulfuromonas versatilis]BCR04989.1 redox-active disulfide protein 2 [Desulfuromonas versatilis]
MRIEILGDGCAKCRALEENVRQAVAGREGEFEVMAVNDPARIAHYGLLTLPGLAIDGELKLRGKAPSVEEIARLLAGQG